LLAAAAVVLGINDHAAVAAFAILGHVHLGTATPAMTPSATASLPCRAVPPWRDRHDARIFWPPCSTPPTT
jgi:hypothetical protein